MRCAALISAACSEPKHVFQLTDAATLCFCCCVVVLHVMKRYFGKISVQLPGITRMPSYNNAWRGIDVLLT